MLHTDHPKPSRSMLYDPSFYRGQIAISRRSADRVVPLLVDLLAPDSVIDVGCGVGTWMASWSDHGVMNLVGLDGSGAASGLLQVDPSLVQTVDLTGPTEFDRTFDVAVSLEVAEHLPLSAAEDFVRTLTSLAPVVVFSAAIPGQGGIGHVNEQWPSWWAHRFAQEGFDAYDVLRFRIWNDPAVAPYYSQNTVIFASKDGAACAPGLRGLVPVPPLDLVHPRLFERRMAHPLRRAVADALPEAITNRVTSRIRGRARPTPE